MAFSRSQWFPLIRALLRPALRCCLRNSFSFAEVLEAAKVEYLSLAQESAHATGKRMTISQLSVMTGLNRREVTRLSTGESVQKEPRLSLAARVLGQWGQDRRFCDEHGAPQILTVNGPSPSFYELVSSVSKDVNPSSVLRELERTQAVECSNNQVKRVKDFHSVKDSPAQAMGILSGDIDALIDAVEENACQSPEIRNLHLRTEYDNIFVEDLPEIRSKLLDIGTKLHRQVRTLLAKYDKDLQPQRVADAGARVVFGTFSLTSPLPAPAHDLRKGKNKNKQHP